MSYFEDHLDAERRLRQLILAIDDMMVAQGMAKQRVGAVPRVRNQSPPTDRSPAWS